MNWNKEFTKFKSDFLSLNSSLNFKAEFFASFNKNSQKFKLNAEFKSKIQASLNLKRSKAEFKFEKISILNSSKAEFKIAKNKFAKAKKIQQKSSFILGF